MSESLGNIYDRSIAIAFGTVFFGILGDCGNLLFDKKKFQNLLKFCVFLLSKKQQNWL